MEPNAHLVLVGPMDDSQAAINFRREQERKIEVFNLQTKITFTGRVDNVHEYLRASDVFILPSESEGLPNSVLEAMACGLPPIMSDIPGISRDVIRSQEEGSVVSERTAEAFSEAILDLLADESRRQKIGKAARSRIVDNFSLAHRAESYNKLYHRLSSEG
jgi:glycosyltransferase involved in cell wall biosynthesis